MLYHSYKRPETVILFSRLDIQSVIMSVTNSDARTIETPYFVSEPMRDTTSIDEY